MGRCALFAVDKCHFLRRAPAVTIDQESPIWRYCYEEQNKAVFKISFFGHTRTVHAPVMPDGRGDSHRCGEC